VFEGLHDPEFITGAILRSAPDAQKDTFFAVGLAHGNSTIGNTVMNTVFLREHHRLAQILATRASGLGRRPGVRDHAQRHDRPAAQARRRGVHAHIGPFDFPIETVPLIADEEHWNRTNWCAIEFNLLYRWHPLVPDAIGSGPDQLSASDFRRGRERQVTIQ